MSGILPGNFEQVNIAISHHLPSDITLRSEAIEISDSPGQGVYPIPTTKNCMLIIMTSVDVK